MSFKPIEPKRDEFRRYLERSGIIEALTKVFSKLIDEEKRPENPLEYIREHLGDSVLQYDNIAHLQAELAEARSEIQKLRSLIHTEDNVESVETVEPVPSNDENAEPKTVEESNEETSTPSAEQTEEQ